MIDLQFTNSEYLTKIETVNTGGGCMVDFITLWNGQVLGVNSDCVCLYNSAEEFWDATSREKQTIWLNGEDTDGF